MNKKQLYEKIMRNVSKEVKRSLNEDMEPDNGNYVYLLTNVEETSVSYTKANIDNILLFSTHDAAIDYFVNGSFGHYYQLYDYDEQVRYDSTEKMDENEIEELVASLDEDQIIYVNNVPAYIKWEDDVVLDYPEDMIDQFILMKIKLN